MAPPLPPHSRNGIPRNAPIRSAPPARRPQTGESASSGGHGPEDSERRLRSGLDYFYDAIRIVLILGVIGLVVLLIDGGRREGEEFFANLATFKPQVAIHREAKSLTVETKMQLQNKDAVNTASTGTATIAFPDGSAVIVQPSTQFEVQLLDYNRGPKRDRSFLLRSGSIFTRISKFFGKKGQTIICTPNAVSAARGTGFSVSFDPATQTTYVEVVDGIVALRNAGGRIEIAKGQTGTAVGNRPPTLGTLTRTRALTGLFTSLQRLDPKIPPIVSYERQLLAIANPLLQLLALTPHGFAPGDNDWARRAATKRQLQVMQQALEAVNGDVPDELNPVTLGELSLTEEERQKMLAAFAGFAIDRYEKRAQNSYRVVVRSRDSAGTVFEMTETGVRDVKQ